MPGGDQEREPAAPGTGRDPASVLELGGRGGARAEERLRGGARFIQRVVVDEAHQADDEAAEEQRGEPERTRPSSRAAFRARLDRLDRPREDVPEQEEQDPGRRRGEERPDARADVAASGRSAGR